MTIKNLNPRKLLSALIGCLKRLVLKRKIKRKYNEALRFLEYTKLDVPEEEKHVAYHLGMKAFDKAKELQSQNSKD